VKLAELVRKGTDFNLFEESVLLNREMAKEDDDDGENTESDDENDEADGFVEDIRITVHCLMDLVPSMEQALQQQNSSNSSVLLEEPRGRVL
jgi:hypothetical protein